MGSNGGFSEEPTAPGSYSHLLFSDGIPGLAPDECLGFGSCFPSPDDNNRNSSQRILHFGDYSSHSDVNVVAEDAVDTGHVSGVGLSHPGTVSRAALPKNRRKRVGSGSEPCQVKSTKSKSHISGHAKVGRKGSLGERVTILQQLVSPFGKTGTASVLHEASCYIRFLHDQIQVLSSPYLPMGEEEKDAGERRKDDLRSRGLCLVPLELTLNVAEEFNGADLWSSSATVFGG